MDHPETRPVSFTHPPVASMWVVTLYNLFLYSDPPPTLSPSFLFAQAIFEPTPFPYKYSDIFILHTYPPMKMEQTECSATSAYKFQEQGNYPEESIQRFFSIANIFLFYYEFWSIYYDLLYPYVFTCKSSSYAIDHAVYTKHAYIMPYQ